jgi:hypothetical protein
MKNDDKNIKNDDKNIKNDDNIKEMNNDLL